MSVAAGKPRVLVALPRYPSALETGSAILIHNNLVELAKWYDLHLLCHGPAEQGGVLQDRCRAVEFLDRPKSRIPRPLRAPAYALLGLPRPVWRYRSAPMRRRVAELMAGRGFDALLLYTLGAVQYCPAACAARAIACIEDPQSLRLARMSDLPVWTPWQRWRMRAAARRMARYERSVLPPLARVLLLSEADALDMGRQGGFTNLGVASYSVSPDRSHDGGGPRDEGMIVFSGNMYNPPNVDAALWFLEEIFPRILERHPAARFWIVGARPDPRIAAMAKPYGDRVVITGRVDDIGAYVRRARVSVCPVRLAIGVQTKVVEALWLGTPVVTTSAGNRGIAASSGEHLFVEDDPPAFAARVAALLASRDWDRLSRNGRRLAEEDFTPERSAGALAAHIDSVRGARP